MCVCYDIVSDGFRLRSKRLFSLASCIHSMILYTLRWFGSLKSEFLGRLGWVSMLTDVVATYSTNQHRRRK